MSDIFHQEAFSDIRRENSKLRTYSMFKTCPGYEQYLTVIQNIEIRTALTKLRLSNHQLMIEKGRHVGIESAYRFCPFCPDKVEDEKHFLMDCKSYFTLRNELLYKTRNKVPYHCDTQKFITLMNNNDILRITAEYIHNAFKLREFLMCNHKVYDQDTIVYIQLRRHFQMRRAAIQVLLFVCVRARMCLLPGIARGYF